MPLSPLPVNRWHPSQPHVTDLLEVGGEAVHILVVGEQGVGLGLEEVNVPDAEDGEQHGSVLLQGGAAEMVVLENKRRGLGSCSCCQVLLQYCLQVRYLTAVSRASVPVKLNL